MIKLPPTRVYLPAIPVYKDPFGRRVYWPLVLVTLEHKGRPLQVRALIDSGADTTLIPGWVAAELGINYKALPTELKPMGIGGQCACKPVEMKLSYRGWEYSGPIAIASPKSQNQVPVLGRADFLRGFNVGFNMSAPKPYFWLERVQ